MYKYARVLKNTKDGLFIDEYICNETMYVIHIITWLTSINFVTTNLNIKSIIRVIFLVTY